MKDEKQSPLRRTPPLRNPGQGAGEALDRLFGDHAPLYATTVGMLVGLCGYEWLRYLTATDPSPVVISVIAGLVVVFCLVRIRSIGRHARRLRLGRDGEMVVGQMLEELRVDGCEVLHDVPGSGFNVDHVVIGPKGVFVIETKTRSKGKADQVVFDGERLTVAGRVPDRDPLAQVSGAARWIGEQLRSATGKHCRVREVVLFPGWWIEPSRQERFAKPIWVLNPKELFVALRQAPDCLSESEIKTIAHGLRTHVRSYSKAA